MGEGAAGLSNGLDKDGGPPLRELVTMGMHELAAMAQRGELRGRHVWVAIRGARAYHEAVAAGDVADADERGRRAAACGRCKHHRTRESTTAAGAVLAGYCGEPFIDGGGGRPCGCLVTVTVQGRTTAAGRAIVASKACPLGKAMGGPRWVASENTTTRSEVGA